MRTPDRPHLGNKRAHLPQHRRPDAIVYFYEPLDLLFYDRLAGMSEADQTIFDGGAVRKVSTLSSSLPVATLLQEAKSKSEWGRV